MSEEIGKLVITMQADIARLQKDMDSTKRIVSGAVDDVKKSFGNLKAAMEAVLLTGFFARFEKEAVQAAMAAEAANNRLVAVLKATGHSAGVTKREIDELADSLMATTKFDDEAVKEAAATFLKFGNIQEEVFKKGLKLAADWAAFTGDDLTSAAQTFGKALSSPTDGMAALQKQVGRLTIAQQDSIKKFMEQNNLAAAQGVILEALQGKIGGTAEAMNTGMAKALGDVGKQWNELLEVLGKQSALLKPFEGLASLLRDIRLTVEGVKNPLSQMMEETGVSVMKMIPGFQAMADALKLIRDVKPPELPAREEEPTGGATPLMDAERIARAGAARERARQKAEARRAEAEKNKPAILKGEEAVLMAEHEELEERMEAEAKRRLQQIKEFKEAEALQLKQVLENIDAITEAEEEAMRKYAESLPTISKDAVDYFGVMKVAIEDWGKKFTDTLADMVMEGKFSFKSLADSIIRDLLRIQIKKNIADPIMKTGSNLLSNLVGSFFKAGGGDVKGGQPYIVGEEGPELMVPGSSGSIIPNHRLGDLNTGSKSVNIVQNIHVDSRSDMSSIVSAMSTSKEQAKKEIMRSLKSNGEFRRAIA